MKRWLAVLLPIFVLSALIGWRIDQKRTDAAGQARQRTSRTQAPARASFAVVTLRDIVHTYEATGSVEAPLSVKIAPKITGRIEYLVVHEGDRVKKGQVLVRIDSSNVEAQFQQQMAAVAEAQFRLAQARLTQNPNDVSVQTQIRQQNAATTSAKADYVQAKETSVAQIATALAGLNDAAYKVENAQAGINGAQANLDNAKTKYNRIHSLYEKGFVAAQNVDDAKAAVTVQESALQIAQGQLKSTTSQKEGARQQYEIAKAKAKADVEASAARLAQANAALDYAQANTAQQGAYLESIAALQASVDAARASLASAQAARSDTVLISPLDGYVTGRLADPGAIASPSQPVISVQFTKQIWVTASVPEDVCAKLHIDDPAHITLDAFPGREFTASIIQINPSADPQSRQFTVRVILSNPDNALKPGMFGRVKFVTEKLAGVNVVPREAVQTGRDGKFVTTVDSRQNARQVPVTVTAEDDDYVCIGSALKPGDKVVTLSAMPIREGQKVMPAQPVIPAKAGIHLPARPGMGGRGGAR